MKQSLILSHYKVILPHVVSQENNVSTHAVLLVTLLFPLHCWLHQPALQKEIEIYSQQTGKTTQGV